MLYMVIEIFRDGAEPVYRRFHEKGRMLPEGLVYVDSWVTEDMKRCYQLMSTDSPELLKKWMAEWDDLVLFEVSPLISSQQAEYVISGVVPVSTAAGT